ncbi:MAG: succinate dehydrogenase, hydrophobic membrane anchor protein [Nitrospirota bacterium]
MKGVWGWLFQRITAVFLVAGLALHFIIMHYSGPEQISHEVVMRRLSNPFWKTFDTVFLISAIYHGFNGMWGIAVEYVRGPLLLRALQFFLFVTAALLAGVGIYIISV